VNLLADSPLLLILLPLLGGLLTVVLPGGQARTGLLLTLGNLLLSLHALTALQDRGVWTHSVGAWGAPLGIDLALDGFSVLMLLMLAVVALAISAYSAIYFSRAAARHFWPLWLLLIASMNALFLSRDLFNLYVTLELVGIAAVSLTALRGQREALAAAMRYLLATLLGSMLYLLGVALVYHGAGSVDMASVGAADMPQPVAVAAFAAMTVGLLLKTALFPFHFWLPAAHSSAPAPVSAILSALVVKAGFYIFLRLWFEVFPALAEGVFATLLGTLGAAAILWGSLQAIVQERAKLLIAYSTVAQLGYFFLALPLFAASVALAQTGAVLLVMSHALAKAALFMAAGNLMAFAGHDRIRDLDRVVQRMPLTAAAMALGGVSLMGLPPSGGFNGKWLLLQSALQQEQWWIAGVLLLGGLLAAVYIFKLLEHSFTAGAPSGEPRAVAAGLEWVPLLLALAAVLLGFFGTGIVDLLTVGAPLAVGEGAG
jgi:formate hydrogenlyase subunit 3/multisubunit Na+/H+ antiporter MnhD subunit